MTKENWIETSLPDFKLRFAREEDVSLMLSFIKELADYEKLSHEVVATEKDIRENLFGEKAYAEAVIGYAGEKAAGFALFFHNFSTFLGKPGLYLEDLYVKPGMRSNGYGKAMLTYLANLAVERGCGRLEWAVLDWNEPAIHFYRELGARSMDEWTVYRLTGGSLSGLAEEWMRNEGKK